MDSVFESPPSDDEAREWELDLDLLPADEPWTPEDQEQPEGPAPGAPPDAGRVAQTFVHGRRACPCLAAVVQIVERELVKVDAIVRDLSGLITQQAYNGTKVKASAGTHAGGGVWDVKWSLVNSDEKRLAWLSAGIIPFDRRTADAPVSKWPNHGHIVVAGCPHRTRSAAEQEKAARLGRNGLQSNKAFRGVCGPILTWEQAVAGQGASVVKSLPIPRHWSPKPWPSIVVDGDRGPQTMDRLRRQLNVQLSGSRDWSHWDVAAFLEWLGEPYTGRAVITLIAVLKLQYRVGTSPDGDWGSVTTRALQEFLNQHR